MHPHAHTTTQTTARFINCARTARSSGWQWAAVIVASPSPHTSPHHQPPHSTPALAPMPACTYCLVKSGWPVPTYLFCKCSQLRLMLNRSAAYRLVDGGGGGGEWLHNDDGVAGLLRWKGRGGSRELTILMKTAGNWLSRLLRLPVFVFSVRGLGLVWVVMGGQR